MSDKSRPPELIFPQRPEHQYFDLTPFAAVKSRLKNRQKNHHVLAIPEGIQCASTAVEQRTHTNSPHMEITKSAGFDFPQFAAFG